MFKRERERARASFFSLKINNNIFASSSLKSFVLYELSDQRSVDALCILFCQESVRVREYIHRTRVHTRSEWKINSHTSAHSTE